MLHRSKLNRMGIACSWCGFGREASAAARNTEIGAVIGTGARDANGEALSPISSSSSSSEEMVGAVNSTQSTKPLLDRPMYVLPGRMCY